MRDYLNIIVVDEKHKRHADVQGIAVPRVGDPITVPGEGDTLGIRGRVEEVHWEIRKSGGMIVTVHVEV